MLARAILSNTRVGIPAPTWPKALGCLHHSLVASSETDGRGVRKAAPGPGPPSRKGEACSRRY